MITINRRQSILDKVVIGYNNIEPCIWAGLALKRAIYLEAPHGVGKTTLGKILGKAVDESGRGFRFFACDKAGMIDIAGLPDLDLSSRTGKLSFVPHDKSIFGAKVILADEITRASKDRMNGWLEITEEKTYLGNSIDYDLLIATGNNSTYTGVNKFDLALKSRYMFYLPCGTFKRMTAEDVEAMIDLNTSNRDINLIAREGREIIDYIREKVNEYKKDQDIQLQIKSFISAFIQFCTEKINADPKLTEEPEAWISPREYAQQMPYAIMALAAYFDRLGYPNPFKIAGEYTVKYCLETRHAAAGDNFLNILEMAFRQFSPMLSDGLNTPIGKLKAKFAVAISAAQKIGFWRDYINEAAEVLDLTDLTTMAGDTLQQIEHNSIAHVGNFWQIMNGHNKTKHIASEVEGFVITEIARRMIAANSDDANQQAKLMYKQYINNPTISSADIAHILGVN